MVLRIATEMLESLRYKLRTFGVNLEGPEEVYCDKKSVVKNSSAPVLVLNKIHNNICSNRVRESQDAGTLRVLWIPFEYNIVNSLTNNTTAGNMRHGVVESIFYNK